MISIVLTRQTEDNSALKEKLLPLGFQVQEHPCLQVVTTSPTLQQVQKFQTIITKKNLLFFFASKNAWNFFYNWYLQDFSFLEVEQKREILQKATFTAVGRQTTKAIEKHHFQVDLQADYAQILSKQIMQRFENNHILIKPRGNLSRKTGEQQLQQLGFQIYSLVVYKNENIFPPALKKIPQAVVFYSPSAVDRFFKENPVDRFSHTQFFSIGKTTYAQLQKMNIVAKSPPQMDEATMANFIKKHFFG